MNDRNARGTAAARRTNRRASRQLGGDGSGRSPRITDRDRNERSAGDSQLSDDIAQEHEPQLNQLQDEPMPSSHYDDRRRQQAKSRDDGHG
jgi:hypothetical protein